VLEHNGRTVQVPYLRTPIQQDVCGQHPDDSEEEGDETLGLSLTDPIGGTALGSPQNATVLITDDKYRF